MQGIDILNYLNKTIGKPVNIEDLKSEFSSDENELLPLLSDLSSQGFIYKTPDGYYYPTLHGNQVSSVPGTDFYSTIQKTFETLHPSERSEYQTYNNLLNTIKSYYDFFVFSHPELFSFFKSFQERPHLKREFIKETYAIFLRMNWKEHQKDLAYTRGDTYSTPVDLVSLEHAMLETVQRMKTYADVINSKTQYFDPNTIVSAGEYRQKYDNLQQDLYNNIDKIKEFAAKYPAGSIIDDSVVLTTFKVPFLDLLPTVLTILSRNPFIISNYLFFSNTPKNVIIERLKNLLQQRSEPISSLLTPFLQSKQDKSDVKEILSDVFSNIELKAKDFRTFNFQYLSVRMSDFTGSNFSQANFRHANFSFCNFSQCDLTHIDFNPVASFQNNVIEGADFADNQITAKILKNNKGTPKNVLLNELAYDSKNIKQTILAPTTFTVAIPLIGTDKEDSNFLAKALGEVLSELTKFSSVESDVKELKTWLETGAIPPFFSPFLQKGEKGLTEIISYVGQLNGKGLLLQGGIDKNEVKQIFNKIRALFVDSSGESKPVVTKPTSAEELDRQKAREIYNNFVSTYKGSKTIPKRALLNFITNKQGFLYEWIDSLPESLDYQRLWEIYSALLSSLKQTYLNSYVAPTTKFTPFPYHSRVTRIDANRSKSVYGDEQLQFVMVLEPVYNLLPPQVRNAVKVGLNEYTGNVTTGPHYYGVLTHTIVTPYKFSTFDYASQTVNTLKVWLVSENQSDLLQKLPDIENAVTRVGGNVSSCRKFFKDWPLVAMNALIQKAGTLGIDQIWVPTGKAIGSGELNWSRYYEDAAKVFGGKLQKLNMQFKANPAVHISTTTDEVYVIDLRPTKVKTSDLVSVSRLSFQQESSKAYDVNTGRINVNYWDKYIDTSLPYVTDPETAAVIALNHWNKDSDYTILHKFTKQIANFCKKYLTEKSEAINIGVVLAYITQELDLSINSNNNKVSNLSFFPVYNNNILNYKGSSLKFSLLSDYDWRTIRNQLKHHFTWVIEHSRQNPIFSEVEPYVSDDMIAQFAYSTFFQEYRISAEAMRDPEFVNEVKSIIKNELGYKLFDPPYIDWLHWLLKALTDVKWFIRNQREISPDLNASIEELARDWFKLWIQEQVPSDMKASTWYTLLFIPTIQRMLQEKGFGDILGTNFVLPQADDERIDLIINPIDKGEGEKEFVDPFGQSFETHEEEEYPLNINRLFDKSDIEDYKEELINQYLDAINVAKRRGDENKVTQLKEKIRELQSLSSRLSFYQFDLF